jgi:hypothetical protein
MADTVGDGLQVAVGPGAAPWQLTEAAQLAGGQPLLTELGNTLENYQAMKANMKSGRGQRSRTSRFKHR